MSKTFDELISKVKEIPMKKVSVAVAQDSAVLEAISLIVKIITLLMIMVKMDVVFLHGNSFSASVCRCAAAVCLLRRLL